MTIFTAGTFFIKKGHRHEHFLFWASLLHATIPKKNYIFIHGKCVKHTENWELKAQKGSELSGHPVVQEVVQSFQLAGVVKISCRRKDL